MNRARATNGVRYGVPGRDERPLALVFAEYFPPYMGSDRRIFDLMANLPDWSVRFAVVPPLRALISGSAEEAVRARCERHWRSCTTTLAPMATEPRGHHLPADYLQLTHAIRWLWRTGVLPVAYASSIPGFVAQSIRLIRRVGPDLVVAGHPSYLCGLVTVLSARMCGIPVLLDYPDAWTPLAVDTARLDPSSVTARTLGALEAFIARRADRITSITSELASYVRNVMKAKAPIGIVGNGADDTLFVADGETASRRVFGIPADHEIAVYSGRLEAWSGTDTLVQTIKSVVAQRPKTTFMILGDGNSAERVRAAIASENLQGNTVFPGYRPPSDMPSLIALANLAMIPFPRTTTTDVCSPIKLYEYMLMKKPIVTTELRGIRESVSGEHVHFVSDTNAETLAGAIVSLLDNPAYRAKLAHRGYQLAKRKFTWRVLAAQFALEMMRTIDARIADRVSREMPAAPTEPAAASAERY